MATSYYNKELEKFYHDCNKLLQEKSFDEQIRNEMYKAYKEIPNRGRNQICHNCMCCDMIKQKCIAPTGITARMKYCYQARNIFILKKEGLYGTKRNL